MAEHGYFGTFTFFQQQIHISIGANVVAFEQDIVKALYSQPGDILRD